MNILFLTVARITDISERGIYTDLMRKFRDEGHQVYIASPSERRYKQKTSLIKTDNVHVLNVKTLNVQKTNIVEKGIATLLLETQFLNAIKKHYSDIKFDLVLYSTPPITYTKVVKYIKKRDNAYSYLLLKDIFPQNAVDLGMLKENGLIHSFFRKKEKKLYEISDMIGCMSDANCDYILKHHPDIKKEKVEVNPNSIEPVTNIDHADSKKSVRTQYGIPEGKTVLVYGGNLGKPQGLEFLLETINECKRFSEIFFLIVGSGTEYNKIKKWFDLHNPPNAKIVSQLPKVEYDLLVASCDVGMIFLDRKFTIPNFPSRLLSYLENKMPVICATDPNTDIGTVVEKAECGFWMESGNISRMVNLVKSISEKEVELKAMGERSFRLLNEKYTTDISYRIIVDKMVRANDGH